VGVGEDLMRGGEHVLGGQVVRFVVVVVVVGSDVCMCSRKTGSPQT
jgi:hypothetical protein